MNRIRVLIADDHTIVRIGLVSLLGTERDLEIVGQARDGEEAVRETRKNRPDVVVMDLVMPKKDGVEATREIIAQNPSVKILILTTYGTADGIAHALQSGAIGAIVKTTDDNMLISAIRTVARGEKFISPEITRMLDENPPVPDLSPRQREILEAITIGHTNKEIASELGIRKDSVEDYIKTLFGKIGASNRAEAVAIALRKQLLKI